MSMNQEGALELLAAKNWESSTRVVFELPTGSGKTAIGFTFLRAFERRRGAPLFYIVPNKVLVEQVRLLHPEVTSVYGRNEYPCLYYEKPKRKLTKAHVTALYADKENLKADEIPCSLLTDCPHRVDQITGKTKETGAFPCPYLQAKYEAKESKIVVSTMAFYLFTQAFSQEWPKPEALVIDEAHRIAQVFRTCLSYEITDWHLSQAGELLERIDAREAEVVETFRKTMIRIIKKKRERTPTLLEDGEIEKLLQTLRPINAEKLAEKIGRAVESGRIDAKKDRETLKRLEVLTHDLPRYIKSFEYSLEEEGRHALNYTFAYYTRELEEGKRVQYRLFVKSYYVAPLVRKLLGRHSLAYSATIGDKDVFGWETGIKRADKHEFPSLFPVENARVFMPTDTPNLAVKSRKRGDLNKTLRRIAKAAKNFARNGQRSLIVVVSNAEREKFVTFAEDEHLSVISYGNGIAAKDAVALFKKGEGDALVGTVANYGEGIDLPRGIAPIIFFLRPGYPSPADPATQFEERRFGNRRWALWNWRVMIEALQVRGRNIRSSKDLGVTFFMSQQFRGFLYPSLPEWLKPAYQGKKTFEQCVEEAKDLLG